MHASNSLLSCMCTSSDVQISDRSQIESNLIDKISILNRIESGSSDSSLATSGGEFDTILF